MHHHYLSRSPWNADMKHVGGLRSWIIFGRQPEGICVESSSRCFLLLRTFCTNIYQFTNYWTYVCPGTCKHCVCWEGCVCECIPAEHFVVCNMCLAKICLQTHVVQKDPWEAGLLLHASVCCSSSGSDRKQAVGNGTFITWTRTLTWRLQAVRSMPRRECVSSGYLKGSNFSLHANSI